MANIKLTKSVLTSLIKEEVRRIVSENVRDPEEEKKAAFSEMWELYREVHGYKPRHMKYENMSLSDIQKEIKEFERFMSTDTWREFKDEENAELEAQIAWYDQLDSYDDKEHQMQAEPHDDDFYDTFDFEKERAKLKNFKTN